MSGTTEQRGSASELNELLCIARQVTMPDWATYVAVRNDGTKAEPAIFDIESGEYLDGPPELGEYSAVFKREYWSFYSRLGIEA